MRARCSFLIPAPQGSTRPYESFSSLALTCTFSGVVFDGGHYWSALRGVSIGHLHPRARVVVKKEKKEKEKEEKKTAFSQKKCIFHLKTTFFNKVFKTFTKF